MELLIRSQDREKLFKFDGLIIYCTCEEMPSTASYEICDSFEGSIATYKSKERALEVLDEIQGTMKKMEFVKLTFGLIPPKEYDQEKIDIMFSNFVYEMPKE